MPLLRLPSKQEAVAIIILGLSLLLYMARQEVRALRDTLAARPAVQDRVVVKRGPVRVILKTITAPDGTKTTERVREIASEERSTEHSETPACAPDRVLKTRYAGLGLDPLDARRPRIRGGLTFFDRLDVGMAYDSRFGPATGAVQAELSYRF